MNPNPPDAVGGVSPAAFASLFQAIGGLRNRRALLAMLGCLVAGVLVASVFSLLASRLGFVMGLFGAVAMFVASAAGINAAGVLLMDQARGVPSRALADAFVYGLLCIPKFIGLALLLVGVALAVFLVLAIVYLVCKIPVLGPMLFVVVFPLSVLISGLTLCGLFLCMLLALPSIWEGATITRALAQTLAIARSRGVEAILLLAVVGLLAGAVGIVVFGVLFTGLMPSAGLAASVFGGDGLGGMLGVASHRGDMAAIGDADTGSSYALAAGIGGALLWALAGSLISLVQLLGLNLVYLRVTEGLDLSAAEAALKARLDDAKRGAADLGQKARDAAERAREQARRSAGAATQPSAPTDATIPAVKPAEPPPAPPPRTGERSPRAMPPESTTPAVAKALTCPQCLSSVGAGDVYCGVCGHRLS